MEYDKQAFLALRPSGEEGPRFYAYDRASERRFRFVDFNQKQQIVLPMRELETVADLQFSFSKRIPVQATEDQYLALLQETIAEIREQEFGKIVLSRVKLLEKQVEPMRLFHLLEEAYPDATVYLFSHPEAGTWLGATPETLLEKTGGTLKTMSLAGTIRANGGESFSAKEEQEQQMVTDFIFDRFSETSALSEISIAKRKVRQTGKLLHLETPIQAKAGADFELDELLSVLHPTPAVSGMPREKALEWLAAHEKYPRSFYAGYFGFETQEEAHFWVNLRCIQIFENSVALYAGGGLTADSVAENEWRETEAKMCTIADVLQHL